VKEDHDKGEEAMKQKADAESRKANQF
jgi:hypothetical protein